MLAMAAPVGVLGVAPAWAQSPPARDYAIPAGDLGRALTILADQSGLTLLFPSGIVSGKSTGGLTARHTPMEALAILLSGSGLTYRFTSDTTVTIESPSVSGLPDDGSITLDQIDVTAWVDGLSTGQGFQGTPDWVYDAPESVSVISRDAIKGAGVRDTRDLMATVPGVYSGEGNGSFPTVSPNIRGLQDSGRVVISIDGARQNAQRGFGNGSSGYQSNSGQAFVDSAFIRSVEVDKNPGASSGNAGSLGGSVTFHTIGADDLITEGNAYGLESSVTRGTNAYNGQGSILGAARLTDTPFSVTAGLSGLDLGEYLGGTNGTVASGGSFKGRQNWSTLLKLEGDFGDAQAALSWMHQNNAFKYQTNAYANFETVVNDSLTGQVSWDPADNELIDLDGRLWLNNMSNREVREARVASGVVIAPETTIDLSTLSFGGSLENTSSLSTPAGALTLNYGVEAFRDNATASAHSATIALNPTWESNYIAFSPAGTRDLASAFLNAELEPADWVTLSGGLRYDWYRLQGSSTYYNQTTVQTGSSKVVGNVESYLDFLVLYPTVTYTRTFERCNFGTTNGVPVSPAVQANACNNLNVVWPNRRGEIINATWYDVGTIYNGAIYGTAYPPTTLDIDRSGGAWLPSITAEFEPVDWFKPYISYSQSFRPPTVLETFFAGGIPSDGKPGLNYAPNIWLRPEQARTWEVGANMSFDQLFTDNDSLRVKVSAFDRQIDDYIAMGTILAPGVATKTYLSFVNLDGTTTMRGVELEANYDARSFWLGGSATWLETNWPQKTQTFSNGTLTTDGTIFATSGNVPPRFKLTLDGGVRLLEETLQVGARLTHVTPTLSRQLNTEGELSAVTEAYTTLDLYGSYAFSDNATVRLAVNNVTDLRYVPASGGYTAPGRTILATLNVKF